MSSHFRKVLVGKFAFLFLFSILGFARFALAGGFVAADPNAVPSYMAQTEDTGEGSPCPSCNYTAPKFNGGFVGGVGSFTSAQPASTEPSSISATGDAVQKVLNYLPNGDTKRGLQEYVKIVGAEKYTGDGSVGLSNTGMASYFSNQFNDPKNSCIRDAALSFYKDVDAKLSTQTKQDPACQEIKKTTSMDQLVTSVLAANTCFTKSRAGISDVAGKGDYKNLEPGWLWQMALKHANGDANSAMYLIGMCGHDDTAQGSYVFQDSSAAGLDDIRNRCEEMKKIKGKLDDEIKELAKKYDINQEKIYSLTSQASSYNNQIKKAEKQKSIQRVMPCPSGASGFFAPQSLSASADIPDSLKKEIQTVQGDVGGAKNIPGKYYHVYGSAFMACQLIQNGISPSKAELIQKQAARLYRGVRMCTSTNVADSEGKRYEKALAPVAEKYKMTDPTQLASAVAKDIRSGKIKCGDGSDFYAPTDDKTIPPECIFLSSFGIPTYMMTAPEFDMTDEDISKKVAGKFAEGDAAQLYQNWYLGGGTIAGKKIPCSDIRVWGPSDLMNPSKSFFDKLTKPKDWSDERYKKASQKLATWDVDFKWTIGQHEAGAKFAGQTCKKRGPNEKPLAGICPSGPPDGKTAGSGYTSQGPSSEDTQGVR